MALAQSTASDIVTVPLYQLGLRMHVRTSNTLAKYGCVLGGQKVNFFCRMVLHSQDRFWLQQLSPVSLQSCKELLWVSWSDQSGAIPCLKPGCSCLECKRSLSSLQRGLDWFSIGRKTLPGHFNHELTLRLDGQEGLQAVALSQLPRWLWGSQGGSALGQDVVLHRGLSEMVSVSRSLLL